MTVIREIMHKRFDLRRWLRPFGWWGGSFAFMAGHNTCPCCGKPGCPFGWLAAGVLGGLVVLALRLFGRGSPIRKKDSG